MVVIDKNESEMINEKNLTALPQQKIFIVNYYNQTV